jgi:RNA polymerase sigma factor (sigma-70 family)
VPNDAGELVGRAAAGEAGAWDELVARFAGLVWATARAVGLGHDAAADVSQTTWLRLAEHLGRLREPDRVGAWLATTARREAIRVIRLQARVVLVYPWAELSTASDEEETGDVIERLEEATTVHEALGHVSGRCRELLLALSTDPPRGYADIATCFAMPIGSIGPTRARCLDHMRALLAEARSSRATSRGSTR